MSGITQDWQCWCSRFVVAGVLIASLQDRVFAQITPDGTLPNNSSVIRDGNTFNITGGTQAGSNLFHSFGEFSVPTGSEAIFNNAADIQNIISRVSGGAVSNIDGLIRANGTANLFLINPNGIVFGANARLNVGGSFMVSTANALQFGNIGFFSATDQNIPSPLLTINPSALLFNQINQNAAIQNNSVAPTGKDPAGFDALGLRVPDGKSLLLVGGNVSINGGQLNANSGRIELGGLAQTGTVALGVDGDNISLKFPENIERTEVSLTNQAGVFVTGAGGGNIAVNARNLEILGGSVLSAGIGRGLGTPETVAGDITLNAIGEIKVAGFGSIVNNLVDLGSQGNGGNITIDSGSFSLLDGARLQASTFGRGNAGNVTVRAFDAVSLANNAGISTVTAGGVGKGGDISINAATLSLIDGALLGTTTSSASTTQPAGRGDAGNVNVNVRNAFSLVGEKNGLPSGIFSNVGTGKEGNGGNITIDSGSFSLLDGARLSASTSGRGNAGNVTVRALDTVLVGGEKNGFVSVILSAVATQSLGNGGNITIDSGSFSLRDRAQLSASTSGQGNAGNVTVHAKDFVSLANDGSILSTVEAGGVGKGGNIDINAATLSLIDGAQLLTATQPAGRGDAGNVNVNVRNAFSLVGEKNGFPSAIFSRMEGTVGNGGNITIDSGSFSLLDGAQLSASTSGRGNAGNVTVRAKDFVSLANGSILTTVGAGGVGKGGNIDINAATLSLIDGAQLQTATRSAFATQPSGRGDAGNVNVNVTGAITLAGEKNGFASGIFSSMETGTEGNGGNITIGSGSLSLRDRAQLSTSTSGQGNAGNVTVSVIDAVSLANNASILSTMELGGVGKGGNIDINAAALSLIDGAQLQTSTRAASATQLAGRGDAGNVNVNVTGAVTLAGEKNDFASGIFSSVATGTEGNGGNITIDSGSLSLRDRAQLSTSTEGQGNAGNVTVRAKDFVFLANGSILSTVEAGGVGKGGNIDINAATLSLIDGAQLQTSTREASATQPAGRGDAGNVNITVTSAVDITGEKNGLISAIFSRVEPGTVGNGGNITIDSGSFSLRDRAQLQTSTFGTGNAGNVTMRAKDFVSLADTGIFSTVGSGGVGKGGNIDINVATLSLIDGAQLQTATSRASATQPAGRGDAGNINVNVTGAVSLVGEKNGLLSGIFSSMGTGTQGNGGKITIGSGSLSLRDGAQLSSSTLGQGNAGTIKVNASNVNISGKSESNFNSGLFVFSESATGTTGDIIVASPRVTLDNSGRLDAESASVNGGNINLETDLLIMRRGAQISTTAGTAQTSGNGGNITINAPSGFILAVPSENSDITANAFTGSGGRVDIKAFGIYGIQPRDSQTLSSDITASSEFGTQGTVELNTPEVDPDSGLLELPTIPVDTEVAQGCYSPSYAQSSFVINGRGGLPPNPKDILTPEAPQIDWVSVKPSNNNRSLAPVTSKLTTPTPKRIVEATGATLNAKGQVVLSANSSTVSTHSSIQNPVQCHGS